MVPWAEVFSDSYIVGFILLFFRFAALFMTVPIFSNQNIPMTVKTSMAFFFTIVFYSSMPPLTIPITLPSIFIAILSEILFGLTIGLILLLAFNVITFAGGQISFMMGFSMASAIDPQSGVSMPINRTKVLSDNLNVSPSITSVTVGKFDSTGLLIILFSICFEGENCKRIMKTTNRPNKINSLVFIGDFLN